MLSVSFRKIYFAFFMKALFTSVTALGKDLASWKQSSQTNAACRQLCQAKDTWVSFHIILLTLRTKSKMDRIPPRLSETGSSVSRSTAN